MQNCHTTISALRREIALRTESALRALEGPAMVSSHARITAYMEVTAGYIAELKEAGREKDVHILLTHDELWKRPEELGK